MVLDDGNCLRYHGRAVRQLSLAGQPSSSLLDHLGPEPLSTAFSGDYLYERSRRRQLSVKQFVMDGKVVVGWAISTPMKLSLWQAFTLRARPAVLRSSDESLAETIKAVLHDAIEQGGTTCEILWW